MSKWEIERFYHTVVNATNLERSIAFYEALGFQVLSDRRDVQWPDFAGDLYGLTKPQARAVLMNNPNDPEGGIVDVMEWIRPKLPAPPSGEVPPRMLAFKVKNIRECAADLKRRGIPTFAFVEPPKDMGVVGVLCARDPDGTLIEFIELAAGLRHSRADESLPKV